MGALLRLLDHDVLERHVGDVAVAAELEIDALDRAVHVRVAERDVAHRFSVADRADRQAEAARVDSFDEDVLRAVLPRCQKVAC